MHIIKKIAFFLLAMSFASFCYGEQSGQDKLIDEAGGKVLKSKINRKVKSGRKVDSKIVDSGIGDRPRSLRGSESGGAPPGEVKPHFAISETYNDNIFHWSFYCFLPVIRVFFITFQ